MAEGPQAMMRRWWARLDADARRDILLVALLLFAYGFFQQKTAWNETSRYDLARAIVEQGTTRIDAFHENTGDKAFAAGHWYSDKAPGTALLGVPVYALLRLPSALTGGEPPRSIDAVEALAFVECAIPTAVLVVLLLRILRPIVGGRWALAVGLAYGLGSMAFPFATMFFGHAPATAALFGSYYLLRRQRARPARWTPFAAGALAGLAVLTEIPAGLGVAVLLLYALTAGPRTAAWFVLGGVPLALVFGAYNWISFGSPWSLGYMNLLPGQFASGMSQGILGVRWPEVSTFVDIMVGPRGLIRLAPWLALAPLGIIAARKRALRADVLACLAIAAIFVVYNAGYYLPFGGWTPGPRFLMPALPFAALLVALVPVRLRYLAVPLMLVGAAVFFVATTTMPNAPERYDDPLVELWLPRFLAGDLAETVASLRWGLPDVAALAVLVLGLTFGLVALGMSFARTALAERIAVRGPAALGALVLAFSFPFPPPGPLWPSATMAPEAPRSGNLAEREVGSEHEHVAEHEPPADRPW